MIEETWNLWVAGGWLMIPLAILGVMIYFAIFELYLYMKKNNYYRTKSDQFGHWVDRPDDAEGTIGEMINFTQDGVSDIYQVRGRFEELRAAYLPPLTSRIVFCTILVGAAPLTGLLGTVIGMLGTFFGLSVSSGGNTIDLVAGGISEALVTTQTGLVLAIPAYVLISVLRKQTAELEHFFTQLEILTILKIEKKRLLSA
jgi:biopolymer transport protein ExbB